MTTGMIGRKAGMMRLYDGSGHVRGVTVIELGPNYVSQIRTPDRDGYTAVQLAFGGTRKRTNKPEAGHLRAAGLEKQVLTRLQEFRMDDVEGFTLGQAVTCEVFEPGTYVAVTATSKGKGFAGGVKRHHFRGGPKTHGQSDRHRAPGSVGSGTTPGRTYKGQRMAGHMGSVTRTVLNQLVIASDPSRNLLFVEGSVPGARGGMVVVEVGRRKPMKGFVAALVPGTVVATDDDTTESEASA